MELDLFQQESEQVKKECSINEIVDFTMTHDVQIIRGEDYQYYCYIDKEVYDISLTPMYTLMMGIIKYKIIKNEKTI